MGFKVYKKKIALMNINVVFKIPNMLFFLYSLIYPAKLML